MLCRVADSLFWMSRYIERAENTVRLVDVTHQTLLESEHSDDDIGYSHWRPILLSLGDQALYDTLYQEKSSYNATEFLTFNRENPSSVFSCIAAARENARTIRDQISTEMWETLNRLYLFIKTTDAEEVCGEVNFGFFNTIKEFTLLFQGIFESTFPHGLGYEYIICAREIERADKTCRILETKIHLTKQGAALDEAIDSAHYGAILRACSGYEAYHQEFKADFEGHLVKRFLLLSRTFPRSALFCIQRLQRSMHAISGCPITHFSNESERLVGQLVSKLNYTSPRDVEGEKGDAMIQDIEDSLAAIAVEMSDQYMGGDIYDPIAELTQTQSQS